MLLRNEYLESVNTWETPKLLPDSKPQRLLGDVYPRANSIYARIHSSPTSHFRGKFTFFRNRTQTWLGQERASHPNIVRARMFRDWGTSLDRAASTYRFISGIEGRSMAEFGLTKDSQ